MGWPLSRSRHSSGPSSVATHGSAPTIAKPTHRSTRGRPGKFRSEAPKLAPFGRGWMYLASEHAAPAHRSKRTLTGAQKNSDQNERRSHSDRSSPRRNRQGRSGQLNEGVGPFSLGVSRARESVDAPPKVHRLDRHQDAHLRRHLDHRASLPIRAARVATSSTPSARREHQVSAARPRTAALPGVQRSHALVRRSSARQTVLPTRKLVSS